MKQAEAAVLFKALHVPGAPLVLFNAWDAGSAKVIERAGAAAIATGSWSVAAANGHADGEQVPLAWVLENARRIVAATTLPVSIDIESGYGATAEEVARTMSQLVELGAVGCNLEDSHPADGTLRTTRLQVERIAAARRSVDRACPDFFINARTDMFFQRDAAMPDAARIDAALERATAYAGAGANGIFVPGLVDERWIERFCLGSPLPVNVMMTSASPPLQRLANAGVARVSHGPAPYRLAMAALHDAAIAALGATR
ncbi:MAG: isocitrate lyase/phosphoenolpyruvate mutase family protein [Xanthomonadales bacterium]|nr:isocitrate lyase/phosphoenolpyruvate mutase family protein [Xanthomonadales bacterium]